MNCYYYLLLKVGSVSYALRNYEKKKVKTRCGKPGVIEAAESGLKMRKDINLGNFDKYR